MQTSKLFKAISTSHTRYMREYNSTGFAYTHTLKTKPEKGLLKGWPNRPHYTVIIPSLFTCNWTLGAKLKF